MRTVKLIFIVALLIACINAASISLIGVIRDQSPNRMKLEENGKTGSCGEANNGNGFSNTDFQLHTDDYENDEKGLVGAQCTNSNINNCGRLTSDTDPTPKYSYSGKSPKGNVRSPNSFNRWFHNSVQTRNINHTITLTEDSTSVYKFESDAFFPIDGKGWKDYHYKDNTRHNFGFCMEAHTKFGYRGGETFRFFGDDDVWVYINNYLVIDLGSLHQKLSMEINLDNIADAIKIRKGNNYRLDFFHCERHTVDSNFQVYTSLDFKCFKYDWCGICEGSGQSCCTEEYLAKNCDDKNMCTVASCNPDNGACLQSPVSCTPSDKCHVSSCDPKTGSCAEQDITCNDNNPCTKDECKPNSGCTFTPIVCPSRNCFNVECLQGTGCNYTAKVCNDGNACTEDSCDGNTGQCKFTTKTCNDNDPCTTDTCDTRTGCSFKGCDDGNSCTDDKCVRGQGCSFTPKACGNGEKCVDYTCNAGTCSGKPVTCTPQDKCHSVVCNNATGCVQQKLTCDDGSACTNDFCDPLRGCYYEDRICNDGNACTKDECDPKTGCKYTPLILDDGDKCTQDLCDRNTGITHPPVNCNDNNVCTIDSCDKNTGCRNVVDTCADSDPCTIDTCNSTKPLGSQCIHTRIDGCTQCKDASNNVLPCTPSDGCYPTFCDVVGKKCSNTTLNCDDNNKCTDDYCQGGNCLTRPTSCTSPNKCVVASCNPSTGCVYTNKTCDDFNPCTKDECNPTSGECVSTPIGKFCTTCGSAACSYDDACKPSICDANTLTCSVQVVTCNDNNPCTTDTCTDRAGKPECSHGAVVCSASANACTPNVCSVAAGGCAAAPVNCSQADPCKIGSCQVDNGKPLCVTSNKPCTSTNACRPAVCLADGTCGFTEVVCNDNDPCTVDVCNDVGGNATCSSTPKICANDICGPMKCSPNNGTCISAPTSCDDGNDCTVDSFTCANETTICAYTPSTFCDDKDMCTNDICNTANVTTPCSHENVTCEPNRCQISRGCNSTTGCEFDLVDCSALVGDACKISTCDVRDGCILEDRVCPKAEDSGCFKPACNSSAVAGQDPCYTLRKDDWGSRVSNDGSKILCSLKYGDMGKKIAIGAGAAAGIAIGAAAAAGFIGYGGKKGYDYWKNMQNERFNGVQNNPLYDGPTGETDNPLYNRMSTQI